MTEPDGGSWRHAPSTFVRRALLAAIAVLVVVGVGAIVQRPPSTSATALRRGDGEAAPAFRLPDLRDPSETIQLAQFRGRPLVLNFWASWCVPCRREMPAFQALHARLGDRVAVVGIDTQDQRDDALAFLAETGVTYPSAEDASGDVGRAYGVFGIPTTVFISADGRVLGTRTGEMRADELARTVDELLLGPDR